MKLDKNIHSNRIGKKWKTTQVHLRCLHFVKAEELNCSPSALPLFPAHECKTHTNEGSKMTAGQENKNLEILVQNKETL